MRCPAGCRSRTAESIASGAASADPRAAGGSSSVDDLGPAFYVPLGGRDHVRGVLLMANLTGGQAFPDAVIDMVTGFGNQAALTLEVAEHRRDAERMLVLGDRDRITRDLHDLVIQRLFAGALTLQSTLGHVTDRPKERIQRPPSGGDGRLGGRQAGPGDLAAAVRPGRAAETPGNAPSRLPAMR